MTTEKKKLIRALLSIIKEERNIKDSDIFPHASSDGVIYSTHKERLLFVKD